MTKAPKKCIKRKFQNKSHFKNMNNSYNSI